MQYHLKPLNWENRKNKESKFAVCDIEAYKWVNFLCIGYYDGEIFEYFKTLKKFLHFIFKVLPKRPDIIYAHFGSRYDFMFILREAIEQDEIKIENMIPRGSGILCFDLVWGERRVKFSDSHAFLPFSLKKICENFKVIHAKLEIDYDTMTKVTPELITYLKHDCMGLYESIEKYREWDLIKKAGAKTTMASQALQVFRLFIDEPIYHLNDEADLFVRKSYYGGRTEIFKPYFNAKDSNEKLYCFDVNSLYPAVMRNNDFPNKFKAYTRKFKQDKMGFYHCKVRVPESLYVPPLGTVKIVATYDCKKCKINLGSDVEEVVSHFNLVHDSYLKIEYLLLEKLVKKNVTEKFVFPTGEFWGYWSSIELQYAETLGVKILEIDKGATFENGGPIFKNYIDSLYAIRLEAKKYNQAVDDILAKLLMNSCYGRFGLNKERENLVFDNGQEGFDPYTEIETSKGVVRLGLEATTLDKSFSNVAIAAWVTSLARIHMHKIYMSCQDELYYTDTDSIFTTKEFPTGDDLGMLKKEYETTAACFLLPKTYVVKNKDLFKKIVMKGFDRKKIQHFEVEDFLDALEGELKMLKVEMEPRFATFKTAVRKGKIVTMTEKSERSIQSRYDKRKIVKREGLFDTMPLTVYSDERY